MQRKLGGDRIGSGKKMDVHLHGYERSTHDLSKVVRSTMSAGTIVPMLSLVALPGDTWDIEINADVKTHPTTGPLFGSFKFQADVYNGDIRLYQAKLHNNKVGIGMDMSAIKLPLITLNTVVLTEAPLDLDNSQINPSSIMAYLGIRGVGRNGASAFSRVFNAVKWLMYWDTVKNYYSNKMEGIGAVIHTPIIATNQTIDTVDVDGVLLPENPTSGTLPLTNGTIIEVNYTGARPDLSQVFIRFVIGGINQLDTIATEISDSGSIITLEYNFVAQGEQIAQNWRYLSNTQPVTGEIGITTFPLENLDTMRELILEASRQAGAFDVNNAAFGLPPYNLILEDQQPALLNSQEGLALKTYQSDIFNNWLDTEWIDGTGGINEVTAIDTTSGSFTQEQLILARKVYDMLNRIMVSGGTYYDWMEVVYDHEVFTKCETPMYMGGLSKELVFQEVVSNSDSGGQPLGTLAGKGVMSDKHKGGTIRIKVNEIGYIMIMASLTPRIDYSQGNAWDSHLLTLNDFHKPPLDGIGFQELIIEQMAWWTTENIGGIWTTKSAGKQPAWTNYMTNYNETYGNFAVKDNEMFMTLNRRYEPSETTGEDILDLTTYIDPVKYNHIFADTALDAQNFWVQMGFKITVRRKMSAKIMPNL